MKTTCDTYKLLGWALTRRRDARTRADRYWEEENWHMASLAEVEVDVFDQMLDAIAIGTFDTASPLGPEEVTA